MKKKKLLGMLMLSALLLVSCGKLPSVSDAPSGKTASGKPAAETSDLPAERKEDAPVPSEKEEDTRGPEDAELILPIETFGEEVSPQAAAQAPEESAAQAPAQAAGGAFHPDMVPVYAGSPSAVINDNIPFFSESDVTDNAFKTFQDLDGLGRCRTASACLGPETLANQPRGDITHIHPSGWHNVPCDSIEGGYLYNRCHLIGFDLSGENDNEKNLITGTRFMNKLGMLPYEIQVGDCIRNQGMHVLYRVTPVFEEDNLLASGVLLEARSVEDDGRALSFCVYCYNVQPGFILDYATGDSRRLSAEESDAEAMDYVLNISSHRFHYPGCDAVRTMRSTNRVDYHGTRNELLGGGYKPCNACRP